MIEWEKISLKELAGFISEELRKKEIDSILVGGACVTIYSQNRYQSYDLDFVVYEDMKKIKQVLKDLGFQKKEKYFCRKDCQWFIEFVSSPVAIGKELISSFETMKVSTGTIKMLRAEDSIKDRLASYFYWNDRQGLEQAINICSTCKIDLKEIEKWALNEGFPDKFQKFADRFISAGRAP